MKTFYSWVFTCMCGAMVLKTPNALASFQEVSDSTEHKGIENIVEPDGDVRVVPPDEKVSISNEPNVEAPLNLDEPSQDIGIIMKEQPPAVSITPSSPPPPVEPPPPPPPPSSSLPPPPVEPPPPPPDEGGGEGGGE